jgi:2-dehydropantoate 2-reductase
MDVSAAAASALVLLGPETPVISIQNGLGGPDAAARAVGRERMLVGVVAAFGASVLAPGRAHHNGWDLVRLGELGGGSTPRLERIAAMWRDAGFRVKCFADTGQLVWEKLIGNCAVSGPCAVTGMTIGEVYHDPDAWPISAGCATEAFRVARARGISLDFDDPVAYVREYGLKIPRARPSMLLDLQAGRRSEIDAINGIIPVLAREHGLAAPYNEVVSGLVRARERALGCRD